MQLGNKLERNFRFRTSKKKKFNRTNKGNSLWNKDDKVIKCIKERKNQQGNISSSIIFWNNIFGFHEGDKLIWDFAQQRSSQFTRRPIWILLIEKITEWHELYDISTSSASVSRHETGVAIQFIH